MQKPEKEFISMTKEPRIIQIKPFFLIGKKIRTSLSENKTKELWESFGPKRQQIKYQVDKKSYSVEIYDSGLEMKDFTPSTKFDQWAAVQVLEFEDIPYELEKFIIPEGNYAVFTFKGLQSNYNEFARYIFSEWLPGSKYQLDERPHFEVMGDKYFGPMNPESEEEIWIPIN